MIKGIAYKKILNIHPKILFRIGEDNSSTVTTFKLFPKNNSLV